MLKLPFSLSDTAASLLIALSLVVHAALINALGVNVPSSDEWAFVSFAAAVAGGGDWLPLVFAHHNEHRYVTLRLLLAANVWLLGWDSFVMMYASLAVAAFTLFGLWLMTRQLVGSCVWSFVPIACLAGGLMQYQNMLWGLQLAFYFVTACAVWTCLLLTYHSRRAFAGACACAAWGTFSAAGGVLIWPIGVVVLLGGGGGWRRKALWLTLAVAAVAGYSWGYSPRGGKFVQLDYILADLGSYVHFGLMILGAPLGAGSQAVALATGLGVVIGLVICAAQLVRRRDQLSRAHWAPIGLALFGLAIAGLITIGRAHQGLYIALESRYVTLVLPAAVALLILLRWLCKQPGVGRSLYVSGCALVAVGVVGGAVAGLDGAQAWAEMNRRTAFLVHTSVLWSDDELDLNRPKLRHISPLRHRIVALEEHRLSLFRAPLDTWRLVRWQDGVALGEVLPGREVAQTFICPVATLRDVSVPFATYQRRNAGTLSLRLFDEQSDALLAARTLASADVRDNAFVIVQLSEPLSGCEGRRLRLEITAPDAVSGAALTVWGFQAFLGGELRQGGELVPGRELGIELNTQVSVRRRV
ncbi:MAG: hypothetical protein RLZZ387_2313 [Chloroflexota bacterium]|jgi:hypothetical protein